MRKIAVTVLLQWHSRWGLHSKDCRGMTWFPVLPIALVAYVCVLYYSWTRLLLISGDHPSFPKGLPLKPFPEYVGASLNTPDKMARTSMFVIIARIMTEVLSSASFPETHAFMRILASSNEKIILNYCVKPEGRQSCHPKSDNIFPSLHYPLDWRNDVLDDRICHGFTTAASWSPHSATPPLRCGQLTALPRYTSAVLWLQP